MTMHGLQHRVGRKHYAIMRIGKLKDFLELCEAMRTTPAISR